MAAIYIVIWLEHHGNRLYGVLALLSKKVGVDWSGWIPLRLLLLHPTNKAVFVPCQLYYTHTVRNINSEGKHQNLI